MYYYDDRENSSGATMGEQVPYAPDEEGIWHVVDPARDGIGTEYDLGFLSGKYGACRQYAMKLHGSHWVKNGGRLRKVDLKATPVPDDFSLSRRNPPPA